jgi:hypothetical protein
MNPTPVPSSAERQELAAALAKGEMSFLITGQVVGTEP